MGCSLQKKLKETIRIIDTKHYDTDFADGRKQQAIETLEHLGKVAQKIREKISQAEDFADFAKDEVSNAFQDGKISAFNEVLGLLVEEGE